ncbi:Uncharacterised protein [Chryseobacterium taklimakanense]|uniref:Uncharacterized protein n=1 Tax=Chryseobacterium taklimakanense TaxID=536441 RepID=A0A239WR18_9FLAO|nr:nuclear transport factor 2 family protein [Chryseobacterium taklimakanense]SNV36941.1 Uncharacterised protein [Chryseobacterium taklimakanense]
MEKLNLRNTICVLIVMLISNFSFGQSKKDSEEITRIANGVTIYFYEQKMDLFDELWADNATFITVEGLKATGRKKIVELHAMGKFLIDPTSKTLIEKPVFGYFDSTTAVVYSIWGGLVFKNKDGKPGPTQSGYLTVVLKKLKNKWKIVSATNAYNFRGNPNYNFREYESPKSLNKDDKN